MSVSRTSRPLGVWLGFGYVWVCETVGVEDLEVVVDEEDTDDDPAGAVAGILGVKERLMAWILEKESMLLAPFILSFFFFF